MLLKEKTRSISGAITLKGIRNESKSKKTGEIVSVQLVEKKYSYSGRWIFFYEDGEGRRYVDKELDFDNTDNTPEDYWTRLEHTYAGMAMQGLLSCKGLLTELCNIEGMGTEDAIATAASEIAHALVEKMKEKKVK